MRLYLSSFDLGNRPDALLSLAREKRRVAVILNALDHAEGARTHWLARQSDALTKLGFEVMELDLRNYFGRSSKLDAVVKHIDVVWINGGNTFILRRAMKQSGFDDLLKGLLARDEIVYAGFSAGAVIVAESLRGLEIVDNPNEVPPAYDPGIIWDGLGLLPFALAVHFNSDHSESAGADREIAFYQEQNIPYKPLGDGEALVIDGEREEVIGF